VTVVIVSKQKTYGTLTIPSIGTETTVIEVAGQNDDYMVEGYIDTSQLQTGDTLTIKEYIAVDGYNYQLFVTRTVYGPVDESVVRFHAKTLLNFMKYKVTVTQTSGTPRTLPYGFITEVMGTV
jgi:pSer/pThr/pTyr-binding forkhead associated (FHA) protein